MTATKPPSALGLPASAEPVPLSRLTRRADFVRLTQQGVRAARPLLVLQAAPRAIDAPISTDIARVGFTATKRIGNAVVRNRVKRRLRAIAAELLADAGLPGVDYVFIGRLDTAECRHADLHKEAQSALHQVHKRLRGTT